MKIFTNIRYLVLLASLVLYASLFVCHGSEQKQPAFPPDLTDSVLREGLWAWGSGHHVAREVWYDVIQIKQSDDIWSMTRFRISNERASQHESGKPKARAFGPYPIRVENGILHIEPPNGASLKYTFSFHGEFLNFPAIIRTETNSFNFTANDWSYTWICSSNPSTQSTGASRLVVEWSEGKETIPMVYEVHEHPDGSALIFRNPSDKQQDRMDRFVWSRNYGLMIYATIPRGYDRCSHELHRSQRTYHPAWDRIKKLVDEFNELEPNKASEATR